MPRHPHRSCHDCESRRNIYSAPAQPSSPVSRYALCDFFLAGRAAQRSRARCAAHCSEHSSSVSAASVAEAATCRESSTSSMSSPHWVARLRGNAPFVTCRFLVRFAIGGSSVPAPGASRRNRTGESARPIGGSLPKSTSRSVSRSPPAVIFASRDSSPVRTCGGQRAESALRSIVFFVSVWDSSQPPLTGGDGSCHPRQNRLCASRAMPIRVQDRTKLPLAGVAGHVVLRLVTGAASVSASMAIALASFNRLCGINRVL